MHHQQGAANLFRKGHSLVAVTICGAVGGGPDEEGVWQGLCFFDFDRFTGRVDWRDDDAVIGALGWQALKASAYDQPQPAAWANGIGSDRPVRNARIAQAFGLSSARSIFTGMKACSLQYRLGEVHVAPKRRRHAGDFEVMLPEKGAEPLGIVVPASSPDAEFGAAIRRCFERCI